LLVSDTTANTLANALYYLAKHPGKQRKLHTLLEEAFPQGYKSWDYAKVKKISYIDDVINETLRLKPPLLQGALRETPPQGIHIGDVYIPGNVNVSVPYITIQRDARWWNLPNEFEPERWTERREELKTDDGPWLPFQLGDYANSYIVTLTDLYQEHMDAQGRIWPIYLCELLYLPSY
jgi:cytochrome P450